MKTRAAILPLPTLAFTLTMASIAQAQIAKPVAFDVGDEHACIVTDCGRTQCWGGPNNTFGESVDHKGAAVDVAVGTDHTCTLDAAGTVACWGRNTNGLLQPPAGVKFRDIEAGQFHTCGIQKSSDPKIDRKMSCWGWPGNAVSDVRVGTDYRQLDAGPDYSCAVTTGRSAIDCWGDDVPGGVIRLLAWDVLENHDNPFVTPERFEKVAVGNMHICWTTTYNKLYCLGDENDAGELSFGVDGDPEHPAGTLVDLVELEDFDDHSEFDFEGPFPFLPLIYKQSGLQYFDVSATMIGACTLYRDSSGTVHDRCWGYPFEFGWGDELSLTIVPDRLLLSGHNFCGWNKTTGAIDCVSEFPASTLDDVEALTSC